MWLRHKKARQSRGKGGSEGCCAGGIAQSNVNLASCHVAVVRLRQEIGSAFSSRALLLHYPCWLQGQLQPPELLPASQQYHLRA